MANSTCRTGRTAKDMAKGVVCTKDRQNQKKVHVNWQGNQNRLA